MIDNCCVIIRSIGERTAELCRRFIEEQVEPKNIVLINEIPFAKAVQRTFEIGLDFNLPWTLAVDGDMLIRENGIAEQIDLAEQHDQTVFKFDARTLDKLFLNPRASGPHLYRTSYCDDALQNMPIQNVIRPESAVFENLSREKGYKYEVLEIVVGVHDYEQYFRDLFRKAYVYARKFPKFVDYFFQNWSVKLTKDLDYKVALGGLCAGLLNKDEVFIDIDHLPINYLSVPYLVGIDEKAALLDPMWKNCRELNLFVINNIPNTHFKPSYMQRERGIKYVSALIGFQIAKLGNRFIDWAKV